MGISEEEKKSLADYVIGTQKLEYEEIDDIEMALMLETISEVADGTYIEKTPEELKEQIESIKRQRGFLKGTIIVICEPKVRDTLGFQYFWYEDLDDAPEGYGLLFKISQGKVEIFLSGEKKYCSITCEPDLYGELLNQFITMTRRCEETEAGADYKYSGWMLDNSTFTCLKTCLSDKKQSDDFVEKIISQSKRDITLFANGDVSFNDINEICEKVERFEGNLQLCWHYSSEYGENHAMVSYFFK